VKEMPRKQQDELSLNSSVPESTSQLIPREEWCEWWTKMVANSSIFKKLLIKSAFYPDQKAEVLWVIHSIR